MDAYEKNNIKLSLNTEINDIIKIQQYVNELKTGTLFDPHGLTQKNRIDIHFNKFRFLNMNKIELKTTHYSNCGGEITLNFLLICCY